MSSQAVGSNSQIVVTPGEKRAIAKEVVSTALRAFAVTGGETRTSDWIFPKWTTCQQGANEGLLCCRLIEDITALMESVDLNSGGVVPFLFHRLAGHIDGSEATTLLVGCRLTPEDKRADGDVLPVYVKVWTDRQSSEKTVYVGLHRSQFKVQDDGSIADRVAWEATEGLISHFGRRHASKRVYVCGVERVAADGTVVRWPLDATSREMQAVRGGLSLEVQRSLKDQCWQGEFAPVRLPLWNREVKVERSVWKAVKEGVKDVSGYETPATKYVGAELRTSMGTRHVEQEPDTYLVEEGSTKGQRGFCLLHNAHGIVLGSEPSDQKPIALNKEQSYKISQTVADGILRLFGTRHAGSFGAFYRDGAFLKWPIGDDQKGQWLRQQLADKLQPVILGKAQQMCAERNEIQIGIWAVTQQRGDQTVTYPLVGGAMQLTGESPLVPYFSANIFFGKKGKSAYVAFNAQAWHLSSSTGTKPEHIARLAVWEFGRLHAGQLRSTYEENGVLKADRWPDLRPEVEKKIVSDLTRKIEWKLQGSAPPKKITFGEKTCYRNAPSQDDEESTSWWGAWGGGPQVNTQQSFKIELQEATKRGRGQFSIALDAFGDALVIGLDPARLNFDS